MDAVRAFKRFPDDPDLLEAVRQLYNVLVDKVSVLITILLRSHPQKNTRRSFTPICVVSRKAQEVIINATCSQAILEPTSNKRGRRGAQCPG
jgi:hypothetical protein